MTQVNDIFTYACIPQKIRFVLGLGNYEYSNLILKDTRYLEK